MGRPFADVLRELSGGETYDELTRRLGELVEAVGGTGRAGKISLELTIRPNGDSGVLVTDKIKVSMPERVRGETVFFRVAGGGLARQDPRQADLPLRRVGEAG